MIYPFLTAVLPILDAGKAPEITVEQYDGMLKDELPEKLFDIMVSWDDAENVPPLREYVQMRRFCAYLNYRIALLRAGELNRSERFEEPEEFFSEADFAVANAVSMSPLDREAAVDAAMWHKLDDLEIGHEMDFEHLCIYRIRLCILCKYARRDEENGRKNFEAALEKLAADFNEL